MNLSKRELRESLQQKLEHRRYLIGRNSQLRGDLDRERARNKFLVSTIANPMVNRELENCADYIMEAVISAAVEASQVVAEQRMDSGDYVIGLDIPSLHIRRHLFRCEVHDHSNRSRQGEEVNYIHHTPNS